MSDVNQTQGMNDADIIASMMGIYEQKAEDIQKFDDGGSGSNWFNPDSKKAKDQRYQGRIKFIANVNNKDKNIIRRVTYKFPKPDGSKINYLSQLSADSNAKDPIVQKYWDVKKHPNPQVKEIGKTFEWNDNDVALIQVIEDVSFPDKVGKFFLWSLPSDIKKTIESTLRPSAMDIEDGVKPNNIFHPTDGWLMTLDIPIETYPDPKTNTTKEKRNYQSCKFTPNNPKSTVKVGDVHLTRDEAIAQGQTYLLNVGKLLLENNFLKDLEYVPESAEKVQEISNLLDGYMSGNIIASVNTQNHVAGGGQGIQAPQQAVQQGSVVGAVQAQNPIQTQQAVQQTAPQQVVTQQETVQQTQQTVEQNSDKAVYDEIFQSTNQQ